MSRRLVLFAFVVACNHAAPAPPPAQTATAASAPPQASAAPQASAPVASAAPPPSASAAPAEAPAPSETNPAVRVLDAGAEPRVVLRYAFKNKHEAIRFDMKTTVALTLGSAAMPPIAVPTIRMDIDLQPTNVDPAGTTVAYRVTHADVLHDGALPAADQKKLTDEMHALVGMRGRFVVDARGVTRDSTVEVPPSAPKSVTDTMDSLKDALRNVAPVLPDEPVGAGARWEVRSAVKAKTIHLLQTTTYTLARRAGEVIDEDLVIEQHAPPQPMATPGVAPNVQVALQSLAGHGTGHVHRRLDGFATTATLHHQTDTKTASSAGGQKVTAQISMTLDTTTKPLP